MATTAVSPPPPNPPFFGRNDAGSLRSFRDKVSVPKTRSLKGKKSMLMPVPSIFGLRRGIQASEPESTHGANGITAGREPTPVAAKAEEPSSSQPSSSQPAEMENDPNAEKNADVLKRPRSKSRTILRLITTKLQPHSAPSPTSPRSRSHVPAPPSHSAFRENREAALRERGLLPPLQPNKDLSRQEREQDQRIPIVRPAEQQIVQVEDEESRREVVTAASLVKQEWEARNRTEHVQIERMKSFRFGGSHSSTADAHKDADAVSTDPGADPSANNALPTVPEVDTPIPSPASAPHVPASSERPDGSDSGTVLPPSLQSKRSAPRLGLTVDSGLANGLLHPSSQASPSIKHDPYHVPLPPSPAPSIRSIHAVPDGGASSPLFPASIPLPLSPNPNTLSASSTAPADNPSPPVISLSPPVINDLEPSSSGASSEPPQEDAVSDSELPPLTHSRTLSSAQQRQLAASESDSSITAPPSLDTSSQTMTISTLCTSESSSGSPLGTKPKTLLGAHSNLKLKVHESNIPIIVESPIEERLSATGIFLKPVLDDEKTAVRVCDEPIDEALSEREENGADDHERDDSVQPEQEDQGLHAPRGRPVLRGHTNPTANASSGATLGASAAKSSPRPERRKSFNPFAKRGHTLDTETPSKRLSMAASIRRSVVGTLIRRSSPAADAKARAAASTSPKPKMFDASHLPPSPSLPSTFAAAQTQAQAQAQVPAQPRPSMSSSSGSMTSSGSHSAARTRFGMRRRSSDVGARGTGLSPPRQAVSPTLHSRGSILFEMNNIEDEETRRVTELAFLG